jgi:hypothetical protein
MGNLNFFNFAPGPSDSSLPSPNGHPAKVAWKPLSVLKNLMCSTIYLVSLLMISFSITAINKYFFIQ